MARALARVLTRSDQPRVLDLGQRSGSTALYLADRGARVSVDDFEPPDHSSTANIAAEALRLPHPDEAFDLVIAWEHGDFMPLDKLAEFAAEVRRVMAPGGMLVFYAQDHTQTDRARPDRPGCYQLTADDRLVRSETPGPARPRWAHTNRMIERALSPLAVQSIHLQRNRVREFLVSKPTR